MIVVADSSPLITLARAGYFELLQEFYREVIVPREVHDEVSVACAGLGAGERGVIHLASVLAADLVLIDEEQARRAAKTVALNVAGSIAVLERGARLGRVDDPRTVYLSLREQGIRYDRGLLNQSVARLGLAKLDT